MDQRSGVFGSLVRAPLPASLQLEAAMNAIARQVASQRSLRNAAAAGDIRLSGW